MHLKLLILLFLLGIAGAVSAQTATPTPCAPGIDVGRLNVGGNCTSNTIDPDAKSDLYRAMATAAFNVNEMPEQIRANGQNGQSVLPSMDGAAQLFGYAKWLFSANTAQELLGRTLAPLGEMLFRILVSAVALVAVYIVIRLVSLIIKAVIWVINQLLKLVPFW